MTGPDVRRLFEYRDGALYWRLDRGSNARAGNRAGRLLRTGYRSIHISGKRYQEHRLIYLYHHGWVPPCLDHVNRQKADNRIENLRPATPSSNQVNTDDRTSHRGVRLRRGKWEGVVWKDGKAVRIGMFQTANEAVSACAAARKDLHPMAFAPC